MGEEDFKKRAQDLILIGTGVTWAAIVLLSVLSLFGIGMQNFVNTTEKVLLPVFNTTIIALLGYVFARPLGEGIRSYLNAKATSSPTGSEHRFKAERPRAVEEKVVEDIRRGGR